MLNRRCDNYKVAFHDIAIINELINLYFLFISYLILNILLNILIINILIDVIFSLLV